jgi:hypothetical protein
MPGNFRANACAAALCGALGAPTAIHAQYRAKSIWAFGRSGFAPSPGLVADPDGNLYGVTAAGGTGPCGSGIGCGTIHELSPPASRGGKWTYTVLYQFTGGADGGQAGVQIARDGNGILYGNTTYSSRGNVFSLTPGPGRNWTFQNLYIFSGGTDRSLDTSAAPLIVTGGHIYGIAPLGGTAGCYDMYGCGTFFRLDPRGQGGTWTEKTLIAFKGGTATGSPDSVAGPDSNGALYVSTAWQNGVIVRYTIRLRPRRRAGHFTVFRRAPRARPQ